MSDFAKGALSIFGAIITLALISVIISRKSQAPQAIQAITTGMAKIVQAAVNPVSTAATNGNPAAATFTTPAAIPPIGGGVPMQY